MTRINLVPPRELMDQHLFAEFREIKMVPKALHRSLRALWKRELGNDFDLREQSDRITSVIHTLTEKIPSDFTLNTGHVMFFYNKGRYLMDRYMGIRYELYSRGMNFNGYSQFDPDHIYDVYPELNNDYNPTPEALILIRARIAEKIAMKPNWYRYEGVYCNTDGNRNL